MTERVIFNKMPIKVSSARISKNGRFIILCFEKGKVYGISVSSLKELLEGKREVIEIFVLTYALSEEL